MKLCFIGQILQLPAPFACTLPTLMPKISMRRQIISLMKYKINFINFLPLNFFLNATVLTRLKLKQLFIMAGNCVLTCKEFECYKYSYKDDQSFKLVFLGDYTTSVSVGIEIP